MRRRVKSAAAPAARATRSTSEMRVGFFAALVTSAAAALTTVRVRGRRLGFQLTLGRLGGRGGRCGVHGRAHTRGSRCRAAQAGGQRRLLSEARSLGAAAVCARACVWCGSPSGKGSRAGERRSAHRAWCGSPPKVRLRARMCSTLLRCPRMRREGRQGPGSGMLVGTRPLICDHARNFFENRCEHAKSQRGRERAKYLGPAIPYYPPMVFSSTKTR